MIGFKRKVTAVLGGTALIASGALFASPAQAAMTCSSVPGQTIGADVKVGPVVQRVPAISNIQLCVGTGTVPLASVTFSGGTCTSNCLTVTIGGGDVDLEGATVSWMEDGVLRTQALNPAPVDGVDGMCVLSVGMPDAPNPNCFIAIGPDDPTAVITPIIQTVNGAIATAWDVTFDTAGTALSITCGLIPDMSGYDFCTNSVAWANAAADDYYQYACSQVPDITDPRSNIERDFCTNPTSWVYAVVYTGLYNPVACSTIPPAPTTYGEVEFCDSATRWANATVDYWVGQVT